MTPWIPPLGKHPKRLLTATVKYRHWFSQVFLYLWFHFLRTRFQWVPQIPVFCAISEHIFSRLWCSITPNTTGQPHCYKNTLILCKAASSLPVLVLPLLLGTVSFHLLCHCFLLLTTSLFTNSPLCDKHALQFCLSLTITYSYLQHTVFSYLHWYKMGNALPGVILRL